MMLSLNRTLRLIIADDQPDNLQLIIEILNQSEQSFDFITVPNGEVLVKMVQRKIPDLIITDWEMPQMSGIEAIERIKADVRFVDLPVIMCTGIMTDPQDLQRALEAGAMDYIRKPIEATELLARVHSMLQLSISQQKIKQQAQELSAMNTLKDRLLSVLSHDIKAPLNTLAGMLYLFDNENISPQKVQDISKKLGYQVQQTNFFLDNLLLWTKSQLQGAALERKDFYLAPVVAQVQELLLPLAEDKGLTLEINISPDSVVRADEESIKLVLRNLISNAIKFCHPGDSIHVRMKDQDKHCLILVEDSGMGIPTQNLKKMFGLHHLSTQGTRGEVGTGIGLLLCKEFVEKNGGEIGVEKGKQNGSTFWFSLLKSQKVPI